MLAKFTFSEMRQYLVYALSIVSVCDQVQSMSLCYVTLMSMAAVIYVLAQLLHFYQNVLSTIRDICYISG